MLPRVDRLFHDARRAVVTIPVTISEWRKSVANVEAEAVVNLDILRPPPSFTPDAGESRWCAAHALRHQQVLQTLAPRDRRGNRYAEQHYGVAAFHVEASSIRKNVG